MTNHVTPTGPALELLCDKELRVLKVAVGDFENNAYLFLSANAPALLIDAATDAQRLLGLLAGSELGSVVTTHRHSDHIGALASVVKASGARAVAGRPDAGAITQATGVVCDPVWTGDVIPVGDAALDVIGVVGHTPGSIVLALRPSDGPAHLFTGDSLFPGGVGKTHSPADFQQLFTDVTTKLFDVFDDATLVHPGHGDDTTVGAERPHLDRWQARGW